MPVILIQSYEFVLRDPFHEGSILTANQAHALNAFRAENIRNNVTKWVHQALNGSTRLTPASLSNLRRRISSFDSRYDFGNFKPRSKKSDLHEAIKQIAREFAVERAHNLNIETSDSNPEFLELIDSFLHDEKVLDLAFTRVEIWREQALRALQEL